VTTETGIITMGKLVTLVTLTLIDAHHFVLLRLDSLATQLLFQRLALKFAEMV